MLSKRDAFLRDRRPLVKLSLMQNPEDCLVAVGAVRVTVARQGTPTPAGPEHRLPAAAACAWALNSRFKLISVLCLQTGLFKELKSCCEKPARAGHPVDPTAMQLALVVALPLSGSSRVRGVMAAAAPAKHEALQGSNSPNPQTLCMCNTAS